jgi:hypothetical protein
MANKFKMNNRDYNILITKDEANRNVFYFYRTIEQKEKKDKVQDKLFRISFPENDAYLLQETNQILEQDENKWSMVVEDKLNAGFLIDELEGFDGEKIKEIDQDYDDLFPEKIFFKGIEPEIVWQKINTGDDIDIIGNMQNIGQFNCVTLFKEEGIYQGGIKNNKMNGYGKMFYAQGNLYVGDFVNGKKEGIGTYVNIDGGGRVSSTGYWKDDVLCVKDVSDKFGSELGLDKKD